MWTVEGDYETDGAVCVRGALDPAMVEAVAAAVEAVLAGPSPLVKRASNDDDGAFVEDFRNWTRVPEMRRVVEEGPWGRLAAELTGSPSIRFHHDHVLVKEPGTSQRTPFHQDQPYYNVDGRGVSFWIPVDPVPLDTCLELVAGSHRGPWYVPRTFLDGEARWFPEGSLAELPTISPDDPSIRRWALEPGDLIAFDFATVHGAPGARPDRRRRVLSLRFLTDDARHAPRPWTTSPPFPGLADELPAGAPFDHPLFPELTL